MANITQSKEIIANFDAIMTLMKTMPERTRRKIVPYIRILFATNTETNFQNIEDI